MSAPENSNSKTPPSLLSEAQQPAGGAQSARILANLEGRVAPAAEAPRRSKAPLAAGIALAVAAVAGWGAWHWQKAGEHPTVVAVAAPMPAPQNASSVVAQSASSAVPAAAQAATIVNDDSAAKSASAPAAGGDRLSQALANGAVDEAGSAPAVANAKTETPKVATQAAPASSKAQTQAEAARKHRAQQTELAQAHKHHNATTRQPGTNDDSDADLIEALVSRTRPAGAKKPDEMPVSAKAGSNATLAARVKDCSTRGFFEDQLCRWRVCDGHWGTDPACPTAQRQAQQ
jgi:hypothetical protein